MKARYKTKRVDVFDISTESGLKKAERFKAGLEKKHNHVDVKTVGFDKIKIEGRD